MEQTINVRYGGGSRFYPSAQPREVEGEVEGSRRGRRAVQPAAGWSVEV